MKQKLIVASNAEGFRGEVNRLLAENWYYVPDTLKVNMSADGHLERFTMLLVQDEDHDELVAAIEQQMALDGCACQGEKLNEIPHGQFPPSPFYKSSDEEPTTPPDCNPGA
jgi:hypothetical protein